MCSQSLLPARLVKRTSVGIATNVNRAVTRSAVGGAQDRLSSVAHQRRNHQSETRIV
jgi:hypothetical protein